MKYNFFFYCICVCLLVSCTDSKKKVPGEAIVSQKNELPANASILKMDEHLSEADSLVMVFYKDPHGSDSLRYTRYYTQFATTDTGFIRFLQHQLNAPAENLEKIKPCRSEGKIWCFSKGEIFQTIYFSAHSTQCRFVYIIKNGRFYYSDISLPLIARLNAYKLQAREANTENQD